MNQTTTFLGLGEIGLPMAKCLVRAAVPTFGVDLRSDRVRELEACGGASCSSLAEAFRASSHLICALPTPAAVRAAFVESNLLSYAQPGSTIINCSTIDLETLRQFEKMSADHGCRFLDAPVSGGSHKAALGQLTFLVGGDFQVLQDSEPLLRLMGGHILHMGPSGSGTVAKICNNLMFAISMLAAAEGCALASSSGLDMSAFYQAVRLSSGQSWAMNEYCPVEGVVPDSPASRKFAPGGRADTLLKDLRIAAGLAEGKQLHLQGLDACMNAYRSLNEMGFGALDVSAVILQSTDSPRDVVS